MKTKYGSFGATTFPMLYLPDEEPGAFQQSLLSLLPDEPLTMVLGERARQEAVGVLQATPQQCALGRSQGHVDAGRGSECRSRPGQQGRAEE